MLSWDRTLGAFQGMKLLFGMQLRVLMGVEPRAGG